MKLNKRQLVIIKYLLKQSDYVVVKNLSEKLKVSPRTIYSDLVNIEDYLLHKGYCVIKKPSKGILLQRNAKDNEEVLITEQLDIYSINGRREEILAILLLKNELVTYEKLSQKYMVSKSSIISDIKFIKKILSPVEGLEIISDGYGTRIKSKEIDLQKGILIFCEYILEENINVVDNQEIRVEYLKKYFGYDIVNVCQMALYDFLKNDNAKIDEYYISNILNVLIILVYRLSLDKHIDSYFKNDHKEEFYHDSSKIILEKIALRLKLSLEMSDIDYFFMCLISNKFENTKKDEEYVEVVNKLIAEISDVLDVDLSSDEVLYKNLLAHVPAMIYRFEHQIKISNPVIVQIKSEFSVIFTLIGLVLNNNMLNNLNYEENEVGFLTLHFQAAIERASLNKKILVICPTGVAISAILYNRLIKILPIFTSIDIASIKELKAINIEQYDLIITTINIPRVEAKVVLVTPLLDEMDIKNISKNYNEAILLKKGSDKRPKNNQCNKLKKYIKREAIFCNNKTIKKDDLLKDTIEQLVNLKYVNSNFGPSVYNRELKGSTELKSAVAIPHGDSKYVEKSVVSLLILKKPIMWNEKLKIKVDIIFLLAIKKEDIKDIKNIISDIYYILDDTKTLTRLRDAKSKEEVKKVIEEGNWNQ